MNRKRLKQLIWVASIVVGLVCLAAIPTLLIRQGGFPYKFLDGRWSSFSGVWQRYAHSKRESSEYQAYVLNRPFEDVLSEATAELTRLGFVAKHDFNTESFEHPDGRLVIIYPGRARNHTEAMTGMDNPEPGWTTCYCSRDTPEDLLFAIRLGLEPRDDK